jgi:hypothetical protein
MDLLMRQNVRSRDFMGARLKKTVVVLLRNELRRMDLFR